MRAMVLSAVILFSGQALADTIDHYIHIANQIPQMEMKADPQAQTWARSARNVLAITSETLAETMMKANEIATRNGTPIFCLPPDVTLDSATMNNLILQTYKEISSQESDKNKLTVSEIAMIGVTKSYPCNPQSHHQKQTQFMQHMNAISHP